MLLRDPDGRHVSVQAPPPASAAEPAGGKQIIAEDPSGNPVELFEPVMPGARLSRT